jgi:hypothetical protein
MDRKRNTELFDFYSKLVSGEGSNKRIRSGSVGHEPDISNEDIGSGVAPPKDFEGIPTYL